MSEEEIIKRDRYKKRRDLWIKIQTHTITALVVFTLVFGFIYYQVTKTRYINYSECGKVDYNVYLKENDFYEEEFLGKDYAYIAELIDRVKANFNYQLNMDTGNVDYEYSYSVDAMVEIIDKNTNKPFYHPVKEIVPATKLQQNSSNKLTVNVPVEFVYNDYNAIAKSFIEHYSPNATSNLVVTMRVNVLSMSNDFEADSKNEYTLALRVPLAVKTFDMTYVSSVEESSGNILAYQKNEYKDVYRGCFIAGCILDVLAILIFIVFVYVTRNKDITYTIRVKKIVSSYKPFIQQINNGFDFKGYQTLEVNTFNEMLEIRDTIQSPILMTENRDKTRTSFIIPTNTKLLYTFDVKVDNYDDIYKDTPDPDFFTPPTTPTPPTDTPDGKADEEAIIVISDAIDDVYDYQNIDLAVEADKASAVTITEEASVEEAPVEEAPVEEAPVETEIQAVTDDAVIEESDKELNSAFYDFGIKCDYSFEAKLALASEETKEYYRQIVMFAHSFGAKVTRSWKREKIYIGRNLFAYLIFKGYKLCALLALDPKEYINTKYRAEDISATKKYEKTPMLMRVTSQRRAGYVIELLEKMLSEAGLKNTGKQYKFEQIKKKSKLMLISENLIRLEGTPDAVHAALAKVWHSHDKSQVTLSGAVKEITHESTAAPVQNEITAASYAKTEVQPQAYPSVADYIDVLELSEENPEISVENTYVENDTYRTNVKYDYSFEAKLSLTSDEMKGYYKDITDFVKSYGVKISRNWKNEKIHIGRNVFAILIFRGYKLNVAFSLNPKDYENSKYRSEDFSNHKKYENTPMFMSITSPRRAGYAIELLEKMFKDGKIENKNLAAESASITKRTRTELFNAGLIRKKNRT